jgi:hypothetical protein
LPAAPVLRDKERGADGMLGRARRRWSQLEPILVMCIQIVGRLEKLMWFLKGKKGAGDDTPLQDAAALLWDESRRQITRQESDLDTLRNRAVALLSVSSIVAGLFGGRLVTAHHHPGYVTAAIVADLAFFAVSVLAVIVVLSPKRKGWKSAQNLDKWFALLRLAILRQSM